MSEENLFKIKINNPLTIEEQLIERAKDGKCFLGWWNEEGQLITWFPNNLNYYEKLFLIDALKRRLDFELFEPRRYDDEQRY